MPRSSVLFAALLLPAAASAHDLLEDAFLAPAGPMIDAAALDRYGDPFRQLTEVWPTPDERRLASGAPGPDYWQNEADHRIDVTLDPDTHTLRGRERITYRNHSPHPLAYLWLQLDANRFRDDSRGRMAATGPDLRGSVDIGWLERLHVDAGWDGGTTIHAVEDAGGRPLPYTIVDTMMRIDLPQPLRAGGSVVFSVDWTHAVVPDEVGGRSQVEILDDGTPLYEIAQWFPRMAPYTDTDGWQHKAFLGRGEFALEFGDYELRITVPDTYVVAASGELTNAREVLSPAQRARLDDARDAERPVAVITREEADAQRGVVPEGTRTWVFRADDVRDVAWAASPAFLWDAWGVDVPQTDRTAMAMSYWPSEGEPLWSTYSTQAVAHTIEVFSEHTVPYPYPVAISVNGPVGGMEYPMICFNGPRPEEDGTYSKRTKYGLIGVIIHEVGHNWFPMILNSDERQWTWMDEGLNTFVQFLAEQRWEEDHPSRRGEPRDITGFMASSRQVPIMTNSESLLQFGNNAYAKPATALNVLRETVLGRERFDHAFRTYSQRWAFKRPQPADLFRTLEDASGVDLDWFWRGWFYTTGHVDVAVESVRRVRVTQGPDDAKAFARAEEAARPRTLTQQRNEGVPRRTDRFPELLDFYNDHDENAPTPADTRAWRDFLGRLDDGEREALAQDWRFHVVRLRNVGGLVTPVPLRLVYADGTEEVVTLPPELWVKGDAVVDKLFVSEQAVVSVEVDPFDQIADVDDTNDRFPARIEDDLVRVTKARPGSNPMRDARREAEKASGRGVVEGFAEALVAAWRDAGTSTPQGARDAVLAAAGEPVDPWARALVIELSDDAEAFTDLRAGAAAPDEVVVAVVRSSGADGEIDSDDDLVWRILADGSVKVGG